MIAGINFSKATKVKKTFNEQESYSSLRGHKQASKGSYTEKKGLVKIAKNE